MPHHWKHCSALLDEDTNGLCRQQLHDAAVNCKPVPQLLINQESAGFIRAIAMCRFVKMLRDLQASVHPARVHGYEDESMLLELCTKGSCLCRHRHMLLPFLFIACMPVGICDGNTPSCWQATDAHLQLLQISIYQY